MSRANQWVSDRAASVCLGLVGLLFLETQCAKGSELPSSALEGSGGEPTGVEPSGGTATAPTGGGPSTGAGGAVGDGAAPAGGSPATGGQPSVGEDGGFCATFTELGAPATTTGSINTTGGACFRSSTPIRITNFQLSNCAGRTITLNGQALNCDADAGNGECTGPFPSQTSDGFWYIDISAGGAGSVSWCSVGWWCTSCN